MDVDEAKLHTHWLNDRPDDANQCLLYNHNVTRATDIPLNLSRHMAFTWQRSNRLCQHSFSKRRPSREISMGDTNIPTELQWVPLIQPQPQIQPQPYRTELPSLIQPQPYHTELSSLIQPQPYPTELSSLIQPQPYRTVQSCHHEFNLNRTVQSCHH